MYLYPIVRNPSKIGITWPGLTIFEGTSLDEELVNRAMEGCDAVLSCLNLGRTSDNPFAKLTALENLLSASIQNALAGMESHQIKRIVVMSAWGVGEQIKETPWYFRLLVNMSNVKVAYEDHARQEQLLQNSALDWTIVRPVTLTNKEELKRPILSENNYPKPNMSVSRKQVAKLLLDSIEQNKHINEAITLSDSR